MPLDAGCEPVAAGFQGDSGRKPPAFACGAILETVNDPTSVLCMVNPSH